MIVGAALAVSACGDDSSNETTPRTTATQEVTTGPQGVTPGASRSSGTGGSSASAGTTHSTPPATRRKQKTSTGVAHPPASKPSAPSGSGHKKLSGIELDLYKQGKTLCHGLPLAQLVREYKPKSDSPVDVARAFAAAYVPASLPVNRRGFYEGCRDALRKNAR